MSATCTTCPYCGVGCGVIVGPDGAISGDKAHPANFGRLCSKGSALAETIDLEGRLLHPMLNGSRTSWDTALDLVATKFSEAIRDHGPDSVAFYVSGQLLTEDYYVANKLMKGYIGSANIDTNSRLCMASSVAGHKRAFGTDTVPGTYEDLEQADLIVLVGSNLAWCHPVLYQRIVAAKAARPTLKVVNIDPRRTATCDIADMHLAIAPDGDSALFNGLLAQLVSEGKWRKRYVAENVENFPDALTAANETDLRLSGLTEAEISAFYRLWIDTDKVVTVYSQGVNQSACGTDKVNAIINCHLATGRIGKPGCGPFSVTGQPNAMGGREVGGLANMLACHLDIENSDHRDAVQTAWGSPTMCAKPGLKAVDLFRACAEGKIKALWVMSTNPAASMPDTNAITAAIDAVPFTVVSDINARTDTGDLANLLLPASGWGEKSGTVTNSERRISRQRSFLPTPGETRPDWRIICDVAKRMGFDGFDHDTEAAVFREYAALSELSVRFGRGFDIAGLATLSDTDYDALQPVQWPVPETGPTGGRFFADGNFFHADGNARMIAVTPPSAVAVPQNKLHLNTGRIRDQWHTMTRSAKAARLNQHLAEPFVEIHPEDARRAGIGAADLAVVTSSFGKATLRALITTAVQKGHVFVPIHWTKQLASMGMANPLLGDATDPISGQPALKSGHVSLKRLNAGWYGFAASDQQMHPARPYAAIAKTATGWQAEIAGHETPTDWEREARAVIGVTDGEASILNDTTSGIARVALTRGRRIAALFFAAKTPVSLSRTYVASLIGTETPPAIALAGRSGSNTPDPGPIICSCHSVGINTLRNAVVTGAVTVEALGDVTCAGTNCGSCKPELAKLITNHPSRMAAE